MIKKLGIDNKLRWVHGRVVKGLSSEQEGPHSNPNENFNDSMFELSCLYILDNTGHLVYQSSCTGTTARTGRARKTSNLPDTRTSYTGSSSMSHRRAGSYHCGSKQDWNLQTFEKKDEL